MQITLTIEDIAEDFPDYRVAAVLAHGLEIPAERPSVLDDLIAQREGACAAEYDGMQLSEIPGVAAWRRAYRQFGIKKTSYRSSVERLVKNVLAERRLPAINGFVDAYNAVSLAHVLPVGADDVDCIGPDVAFRYSRDDDTFYPLGQEGAENDPPKSGEVVLASGPNVMCRRWNWYQDARSPITPDTRHALVTVQSNGEGNLEAAAEDLCDLLAGFCNAECDVAIASRATPTVDLKCP